jgi:hypothetical protein
LISKAVFRPSTLDKETTMTDTITKKTFTVYCAQGLIHTSLINLLMSKGWTYVIFDDVKPDTHIDFAWVGATIGGDYLKYDSRIYSFNTTLKNLISGSGVRGDNVEKDIVTNKCSLYFKMIEKFYKVAKRNLCQSHSLKKISSINNGEVLIVRPVGVGAGGGNGVHIVTNDTELENVQKLVRRKFRMALASEYIRNPMLIKKKKFHLRMYWMVCPDRNGVYQSHLYNIGKIVTAQDDFRLDDFQNPNIHDTHFKSTPVNRYFPYDLASENWIQKTEIDDYYSQMATVLDCAFQILKPEIKSYPESKYGFEVFGCDFMITTDNVVKLLEINARHDYGVHDMEKMNSEGFVKFCEGFYDWVYNTAIAPIFD